MDRRAQITTGVYFFLIVILIVGNDFERGLVSGMGFVYSFIIIDSIWPRQEYSIIDDIPKIRTI